MLSFSQPDILKEFNDSTIVMFRRDLSTLVTWFSNASKMNQGFTSSILDGKDHSLCLKS